MVQTGNFQFFLEKGWPDLGTWVVTAARIFVLFQESVIIYGESAEL